MKRPAQRKHSGLEVRVTFEVSHLAADCLVDAYERIVPTAHRLIGRGGRHRPASQAEMRRERGARAC